MNVAACTAQCAGMCALLIQAHLERVVLCLHRGHRPQHQARHKQRGAEECEPGRQAQAAHEGAPALAAGCMRGQAEGRWVHAAQKQGDAAPCG